ncbi:tyrosine-type recombinase/integrase [Halalkalibacter krulwichiae]|uniref:Tyrosine recombinase XerC n=1 Tax=Halalkalibacter krulwichiae TaxID=199441 RepID=A0A1X9MI10_9BACI|nr:tyrosine-type recombinase/integrase [Halalkalibacter krulwichiae]ARK31863.1 Tyrosine recombinase XerC [Halalkalibacter krulwichiae]
MVRRKNKLTEEQLKSMGIETVNTFDGAIEILLKHCKIKNLRSHTVKFYRNELNAAKKILEKQKVDTSINKITDKIIRRNIIDYMSGEGKTITAINSRLRALKRLFNFLYSEDYLFSNPMSSIVLLKTEKRIQPTLTMSEIKNLLEQPDQSSFVGIRNFCILLLFLETGIRCFELANLKVKDVIFEENLILVSHTKNRKQRFVPFQEKMKRKLQDYIKLRGDIDEEALFVTVDNTALSKRKITEWITTYAKDANIEGPCSAHVLRYTFVKFAIKAEANLFVLQEIVGHSTLNQLRYYYSVYGNDITTEHKKFSIADKLLS